MPKRPPVKPVDTSKPTAARTHARDDFHIPIRITVNIPQLPTVLDYLVGLAVAPYAQRLKESEALVATLKSDLQKALKSARKLKDQKAKAAEEKAATAEAERLEDEQQAAELTDMKAQRDALQKRVDEETATDEEKALLAELVTILDEEDGPDDEETPEEPTEPENPDDELPVEEVEPEPNP